MEQIVKNLFLGSDKDVEEAKDKGFSICAMCKAGPNSYKSLTGHEGNAAPKGPNYYWFERDDQGAANLVDSEDPAFIHAESIYPALDFIYNCLDEGKEVLVHCNAGHSRGPTTTLMYLRCIGEMPGNFHQSLSKFKTIYNPFDPQHGMKQFANEHWGFLKDKLV